MFTDVCMCTVVFVVVVVVSDFVRQEHVNKHFDYIQLLYTILYLLVPFPVFQLTLSL